jgi:putative two-component system response regulator
MTAAEILVVDDSMDNAELIGMMLQTGGYTVRQVYSGREAIREVGRKEPDLILLDVVMPDIDGIEVTRQLKHNAASRHLPIILLSGRSDDAARLAGLEAGAEDWLTKPVNKVELISRVRNLMRLKEGHDFLQTQKRLLEHRIKFRTEQLEASYQETMLMLVRAVEQRDPRFGGHVARIRDYCKVLAAAMGQDYEFQQKIYHASPMYDVGKIGIPDAILLKEAPMNEQEWAIMKTHTTQGAKLLSEGKSEYLRMGADIAHYHHENWDGSGYPNGLAGADIPLPARIMALCDTYDALRCARPYKAATSHGQAVEIIAHGDGKTRPEHFDPAALRAFMDKAAVFEAIYAAHDSPVDKEPLLTDSPRPEAITA